MYNTLSLTHKKTLLCAFLPFHCSSKFAFDSISGKKCVFKGDSGSFNSERRSFEYFGGIENILPLFYVFKHLKEE